MKGIEKEQLMTKGRWCWVGSQQSPPRGYGERCSPPSRCLQGVRWGHRILKAVGHWWFQREQVAECQSQQLDMVDFGGSEVQKRGLVGVGFSFMNFDVRNNKSMMENTIKLLKIRKYLCQ